MAVTKFVYTDEGPKTKTFITNNKSEILNAQGSKYCPVDISEAIKEVKKTEGKIAYVGTPCQIAGIRSIQEIDQEFDRKICITVSNFCGGFKNFNNIKKIAHRHSIDYNSMSFFRFRGGGQPGSMIMKDSRGNEFESSYKLYGGFSGYSKILRCHLCVDATGELADISFGDAWLDRYLDQKEAWSVILTRSAEMTSLIKDMVKAGRINTEKLSHTDVCLSQKSNITSKKYRQYSRHRLYRALGYSIPEFDGGFDMKQTSLKVELCVYCKHRIPSRF